MKTEINVLEVIEIRENGSKLLLVEQKCQRCYGFGYFAHLKQINNGTCFKCNGTGMEKVECEFEKEFKFEIREETKQIKRHQLGNSQISYKKFVESRNEEWSKNMKLKVDNINNIMKKEKERRNAKDEDDFDILDLL